MSLKTVHEGIMGGFEVRWAFKPFVWLYRKLIGFVRKKMKE